MDESPPSSYSLIGLHQLINLRALSIVVLPCAGVLWFRTQKILVITINYNDYKIKSQCNQPGLFYKKAYILPHMHEPWEFDDSNDN